MNLQKPDIKWHIQSKSAYSIKDRIYGYQTMQHELSISNSAKFSIPTEFVGCINDQDQKEVIKMLKFTHLKWCAKTNYFALGYNKINNQKRQGHLSLFDLNEWKLFYKKFSNDEAMVGLLSQEYLNKIFGIGSNGGIYSIEKGQGGLEQRPTVETKISQITDGCFSPNHYKIAFSSQDKLIYIYDVQSEQKETLAGHGKEIYSVQWNPENSLLASGADDETIRIWDASSREEVINLKRHNLGVKKVRWNRDGNYILTAGKDKQTMLFDIRKMDSEIFKIQQNQIDCILWHPKYNNVFLTGDNNGSIGFYNINAPNEPMYIQTIPETMVTDLAIDQTGQMMSVIRAKQPQQDQKINIPDQIAIYKTI